MDLAAFKARFPEMTTSTDPQIQAALDAAAARTSASIFGALYDEAHGYLTAHLLSAWPGGKDTRIKGMGFETTYSVERARLEDLVGPAQVAAAELGG